MIDDRVRVGKQRRRWPSVHHGPPTSLREAQDARKRGARGWATMCISTTAQSWLDAVRCTSTCASASTTHRPMSTGMSATGFSKDSRLRYASNPFPNTARGAPPLRETTDTTVQACVVSEITSGPPWRLRPERGTHLGVRNDTIPATLATSLRQVFAHVR